MCDGAPCYDDGTACESNLLIGPTLAVMYRLGAKDDHAIFHEGEWWRVISCNWLHAGVLHLNQCGRYKWPPNFVSLLAATVINMAIGLTPWVDNFMHIGGFVAGLLIGMSLFAKRGPGTAGERKYTHTQRVIVVVSAILLAALIALAVAAGTSPGFKSSLRSCSFCEHINCVEISLFTEQPWWSCCLSHGSGACSLRPLDDGVTIAAMCNMTDGSYERTCDVAHDDGCDYDPTDQGSITALCTQLCSSC